ncbi:toll/interleukin-1 receptor domain-containing protein [Nonomuraea sp. NN258]|uniref:toll/interleukin-1 receptor domain-containing protein n=1 Tax=Nonomuraea antri TaxID=2730852 RepID=UPI001569C60D|nr:toll/interleukin-1 receptor domain-containing protein [Nonomuraea antri]NRQ36301.1 toll/interleukin-1 receptor domain-containing protein [Nonomuraea antri]
MSDLSPETLPGHAFISYVREDKDRVDRLQDILESAGIRVWRDIDDLWPGQDWKIEIRNAITSGSLAFIACFSEHTQARQTSYQNEELLLAVDQVRLRPPGAAWLIPVRFADCAPPEFDLGAGRTLGSLQRVDLFGSSWERGTARLVAAVLKILGTPISAHTVLPAGAVSAVARLKETLLDNGRQIETEQLIADASNSVRKQLQDEAIFPVESPRLTNDVNGIKYLVDQAQAYAAAVEPVVQLLVPGCTWGRAEHEVIWTRTLREVANADKRTSGKTALINLSRLPALILMYAAGIAALHRENFGSFRAVTSDPVCRAIDGVRPLVDWVHPWLVFENNETTANVLAMQVGGKVMPDSDIEKLLKGRIPKRHTPVSDYLHDCLRDHFSDLMVDDAEYTDTFDQFEILIGLVAADAYIQGKAAGQRLHGPYLGAFTWRDRYSNPSMEQKLRTLIETQGQDWPPLQFGLFGGSSKRASEAAELLVSSAEPVRQRRW